MTGSIIDGGHPYNTRILVRRPIDPRKFEGTVFVEWSKRHQQHRLRQRLAPGLPHGPCAGCSGTPPICRGWRRAVTCCRRSPTTLLNDAAALLSDIEAE
jgi:hypothetical protein